MTDLIEQANSELGAVTGGDSSVDGSVVLQTASAGNGILNVGNTAINVAVIINGGMPGVTEPVNVFVNVISDDGVQGTGTLTGITTPSLDAPANPPFATAGDATATTSQTLYTAPGTDILEGGKAGDVFFVDATSPDGWAEIDNMHPRDIAAILGFQVGQSTVTWVNGADPNGQSGATAEVSLDGNGKIDAQITFTGVAVDTAQNWTESNSSLNGVPFLSLSA